MRVTATVAIPTRNRRGRLIPLLERLIPQAADVGADILVVDNGSSDGTAFWTGWGEGFIDARYQRLRKVAGRLRWHSRYQKRAPGMKTIEPGTRSSRVSAAIAPRK